jgi:dTDP-glucose pyrophosphorylase
MNIIISCAGLGNRFKERGFKTPKHLLKINDKTLIELAIESLNIEGKYYFIIRKDNEIEDNTELINILKKVKPDCEIIEINYVTEGPASTCYLVKDIICHENELIITNCDQVLEYDSNRFLNQTRNSNLDCSVLTYSSIDKKNSFIRLNNNGKAEEIKEKVVISNTALVGVHYFKKTKYFIETYEEIFKENIRAENGEFYLSTICNQLIQNKYKVGHIPLLENEKYYSTGTPNCYFKYLKEKGFLNIQISDINEMTRGWLIGDFEPSILRTKDFEVGYLNHKKGELWPVHYHAHMIEINVLIKGKMILNDIEINENQVFVIHKNDIACPIFVEDCFILCIKVPSIIGDKVII